jgi:hypothetical protein
MSQAAHKLVRARKSMNQPTDKQINAVLEGIIRDGFNRSLGVLAQVGVIDRKKLAQHYKGMGSKYYDLVSEQINFTAQYGTKGIRVLFAQNMDFPKLQPDQHAVVRAEVSTGIILNDSRQWHTGSGEVWQVFDSLESARKFAENEVFMHPSVECAIYNCSQQYVETVRKETPLT